MRRRYRRHWRYRLQALDPGNRSLRRSRQLMSTTWLPRSEESPTWTGRVGAARPKKRILVIAIT